MNPGPWGMVQTGVPFGEVAAVRDGLGITASVGRPDTEHVKRPVQGFSCPKSEVSGRRLWGLFLTRFAGAHGFFADHFVANYCPLAFMEESGRNRTPDKLPKAERDRLFAICDRAAIQTIEAAEARIVVGIGKFTQRRLEALRDRFPGHKPTVLGLLHPSPANPQANRGWSEMAERTLIDNGVWSAGD